MICTECEELINSAEWLGRCIASNDMHFGKLSFFRERLEGAVSLRLVPIYNMLPMLYAPEKSGIVERMFRPARAAEAGAARLASQQEHKILPGAVI